MRLVSQTKFYEGPESRGSCVQACVATVFGIDEAMAPTQRDVSSWTTLNYPGLGYTSRDCEPTGDAPAPWGVHGLWIAGAHTQTEGFTDPCSRCWEFEGNDEHGPPLCETPRPCPFCGEQWGLPKGIRPGYHAIVMHGRTVEHDPNPKADWDSDRVFIGASWWVVTEPSRLIPRRLPERSLAA